MGESLYECCNWRGQQPDPEEAPPNFYSWETPDFELKINPPGSLVDYLDIVVSIQQDSQYEHFHLPDLEVEGDVIYLTLDQETAGKFSGDRPANVQVNVLYDDNTREATTWGKVWVRPNLYRQVMS